MPTYTDMFDAQGPEVDALGAEERFWSFWRAIFSRFRR
jgi:hypothetical protein